MADISASMILDLIQSYGLAAVFIGMILEEVLFVIPAAVIIVSAGALLIQSSTALPALMEIFFEISLIGSLGITAGSFFMYGAGFYGGKPAVNKVGKYANMSYKDVEKFESHFSDKKEKRYLLLLRTFPIFPITTVSAAAGLFRMNWRIYALITFVGLIPRHLFYGFLGWKAGSNYASVLATISKFSQSLTIIGITSITSYLIIKYRRKIKQKIKREKS